MLLGIMTSRRWSYFRRFHWISRIMALMSHSSSTQVGFPHPSRVTVPCDTALKAVAERYIVLGWTSMIGRPLLMGANQSSQLIKDCSILQSQGICVGEFRAYATAHHVLLESIVLLCFIEYTLKADTPDIWPKLLQPPAMGFFTAFPILLMYKTIWTCACRF